MESKLIALAAKAYAAHFMMSDQKNKKPSPTEHFTAAEFQNPSVSEFCLAQKRR